MYEDIIEYARLTNKVKKLQRKQKEMKESIEKRYRKFPIEVTVGRKLYRLNKVFVEKEVLDLDQLEDVPKKTIRYEFISLQEVDR